MSHLTLHADGFEAALGEVGAIRVPQVSEGELCDASRIEAGGFGGFVESTGRDVALVHRSSGRRGENKVVCARQPVLALDDDADLGPHNDVLRVAGSRL